MPSWKKVIVSGSAASLSSLTTSGNITLTKDNGTIFVKSSTSNNDVFIRLNEGTSFNGGYLQYDGSTNIFNIGVHNPFDSDVANDTAAIQILRENNTGDVIFPIANQLISGSSTSTGSFGRAVIGRGSTAASYGNIIFGVNGNESNDRISLRGDAVEVGPTNYFTGNTYTKGSVGGFTADPSLYVQKGIWVGTGNNRCLAIGGSNSDGTTFISAQGSDVDPGNFYIHHGRVGRNIVFQVASGSHSNRTTVMSITTGSSYQPMVELSGDISGSADSTGSFGEVVVGGNVSIPTNSFLMEKVQGTGGNRIMLKNHSTGNMEFQLENSNYDYVFPDGKFGIGTTAPDYGLHLDNRQLVVDYTGIGFGHRDNSNNQFRIFTNISSGHGELYVRENNDGNRVILKGNAASEFVYGVSGSATSTGSFGHIVTAGHIVPTAAESFDLGTADKPFRDLHVSSGSIKMYAGDEEIARIQVSDDDEFEFFSTKGLSKEQKKTFTKKQIRTNATPGKFRGGNIGTTTSDATFGSVTVEGDLIAKNYIVSSSTTYMTTSFSSGNTTFGDSSDDKHMFTGSINISGSIIGANSTPSTASFSHLRIRNRTYTSTIDSPNDSFNTVWRTALDGTIIARSFTLDKSGGGASLQLMSGNEPQIFSQVGTTRILAGATSPADGSSVSDMGGFGFLTHGSTHTSVFATAYRPGGNNGNFGVKFHNQFGAKSTGSMIIHPESTPLLFQLKGSTISGSAISTGSFGVVHAEGIRGLGGTYGGTLFVPEQLALGNDTDTMIRKYTSNVLEIRAGGSDLIRFDGNNGKVIVESNLEPDADNSYNLGSSTKRWANIHSADLQLSNEGTEGNDVDGTTGNWTLQEGEEDIYLINNKTGKKYSIMLKEVKQ